MDSEELKSLAIRLGALTDMLEQRSRQAVHEVSQSSDQLQQVAKGFGLEVQRLAADAVDAIGSQANDVVRRGLQQAMDRCGVQLEHAAQQATQATVNLRNEGIALQRAQRGLIWKGALGLLVGSVLAAGGSSYLVWKNWKTSQQAEFSTAIVRAMRSGILTQCDGVLCIKASKNATRYEKNSDYILLKE